MADSHHKWVVLVAACLVTWVSFGFPFQFGVFFIPMLDQYRESRSQTVLVQSLLMGCALCFSAISGVLNTKFGHARVFLVGAVLAPLGCIVSFFAQSVLTLILCIGVITGIGVNLLFVTSVAVVGQVFEGSTRLLALALVMTTISLAGLSHPIIIRRFLDTYGLNGSFLMIGGIFLNNIAAAVVFWYTDVKDKSESPTSRRVPETSDEPEVTENHIEDQISLLDIKDKENDSQKELKRLHSDNEEQNGKHEAVLDKLNIAPDQNALLESQCVQNDIKSELGSNSLDSKNRNNFLSVLSRTFTVPYALFVIGASVCIAPINGYQSLVLDIFRWKGFSQQQGLSSFLVFNLMGFIGRVSPGVIKQKKGVNTLLLPICYAVCGVIGHVFVILAVSYPVMLIGVGLIGFGFGGIVSSNSIVVSRIIPGECFSLGAGISFSIFGLMTSMMGPLFGTMRDRFQTYTHVLILSMALVFTGLVLFVLATIFRSRNRRRYLEKEVNIK